MNYDTIEPALLDFRSYDDFPEQSTLDASTLTSIQLPSLQDIVGHDVSTRRNDPKHNDQSAAGLQFLSLSNGGNLFVPNNEDNAPVYQSNGTQQSHGNKNTNRALGDSSPQSLRKILESDTNTTSGGSSKKRPNPEPAKDEFVQLPQPQPPKKKKTATQIVPPIITGIHEVPQEKKPYLSLARIESGSFHDSNGRNSLNTAPPPPILPRLRSDPGPGGAGTATVIESIEDHDPAPVVTKKKRQTKGPRRGWEDDETEWLIKGIAKHGFGNWTDIVNDPIFPFKNRIAAQLKDRARTLAPTDVRAEIERKSKSKTSSPEQESARQDGTRQENTEQENTEGSAANKLRQKKSRAHRMNADEIIKIIECDKPLSFSGRSKNMFTAEEDRDLLKGYAKYGRQWARILADPEFHFRDREATNLRDRYRNMMKKKERESPVQTSNQTLTEPRGNEVLSNGHPSSSSLVIPAQDPPALQSSTLNSGDPRTAEGLSSGHPSSSDLYSQAQGTMRTSDSRPKDIIQVVRNNGHLPTIDPTLQAQGPPNKINEPYLSGNSRNRHDQHTYQSVAEFDLRSMTLNRADEPWSKETQAPATTQTAGLRIEQIISPEDASRPNPNQNLFSYNLYTEQHLENPESQVYPQVSFDWPSNIPAPFPPNISQGMAGLSSGMIGGDMDINRLLQNDDHWNNDITTSNTQGMDGRARQSFTNINSILSSDEQPEPAMSSQPSYFTNMLNSDLPNNSDELWQ